MKCKRCGVSIDGGYDYKDSGCCQDCYKKKNASGEPIEKTSENNTPSNISILLCIIGIIMLGMGLYLHKLGLFAIGAGAIWISAK